jgi:hypothetical protein
MLEFSAGEYLQVLRVLQSMRGRVEDPGLLERLIDQHLVRMHDGGVSLPPDITEETRERLGIFLDRGKYQAELEAIRRRLHPS